MTFLATASGQVLFYFLIGKETTLTHQGEPPFTKVGLRLIQKIMRKKGNWFFCALYVTMLYGKRPYKPLAELNLFMTLKTAFLILAIPYT